jgi:hypothetical protein
MGGVAGPDVLGRADALLLDAELGDDDEDDDEDGVEGAPVVTCWRGLVRPGCGAAC